MTTTVMNPSTPVSYRSLPHKTQLLILMLARFTEPLTTSSIHSYLFFQLHHFSPSAPPSILSTQAGLLLGCKTAAHVCTGLAWGRLADHPRIGRKNVLVVGLAASSLATVGYGFSRSFEEALVWQMLDGALNATIAMVRCMTAELNPEKRYRVRALTLLPLCANLGSLLGPLIGGFLSTSKPESSIVLRAHPYALPNICVASVQAFVAVAVMLFLHETHHGHPSQNRHFKPPAPIRPDSIDTPAHPNNPFEELDETAPLLTISPPTPPTYQQPPPSTPPPSLPFNKIWTPNVLSTLLAQFIISGHLGTFASLWAIFLSMPTAPLPAQHPPLHFTGGLGMQPHSVGIAMSAFSFAGIILQIVVYPSVQERWGTIAVWRAALYIFPLVYILAPFCALVASITISSPNQDISHTITIPPSNNPRIWLPISLILILFAAGRTGVVPATSLLINDCTPHPSVRGTIHTAGVIVSNLSRSIFPPIAFAALAFGLRVGVVGIGFWFVAVLAILSCVASLRVREGANGEDGEDGR